MNCIDENLKTANVNCGRIEALLDEIVISFVFNANKLDLFSFDLESLNFTS